MTHYRTSYTINGKKVITGHYDDLMLASIEAARIGGIVECRNVGVGRWVQVIM